MKRHVALAWLATGLTAGAAQAAPVAADGSGFGIEGAGLAADYQVPGPPLLAPGRTTVAFTATAPPGAKSVIFRLSGIGRAATLPATNAGARVADPGYDVATQPTLQVEQVRLDGPGALTGLPATAEAYVRSCVRDGLAVWGQEPGYQLVLAGGQRTRILVDVSVPAGIVTRTPSLTLQPFQWQTDAPDSSTAYSGATVPGQPLAVSIPRGRGADAVTLTSRTARRGATNLEGVVWPARRGTPVELIGRAPGPALQDIQTAPFATLGDSLRRTAKGQRRLARVRTDSNGRWRVRLTLPRRLAVIARTVSTDAPGASCPLVLNR